MCAVSCDFSSWPFLCMKRDRVSRNTDDPVENILVEGKMWWSQHMGLGHYLKCLLALVWTFWWRSKCSFLINVASHREQQKAWASSGMGKMIVKFQTAMKIARWQNSSYYNSPWGISPDLKRWVSLSWCFFNLSSSENDNLQTWQM